MKELQLGYTSAGSETNSSCSVSGLVSLPEEGKRNFLVANNTAIAQTPIRLETAEEWPTITCLAIANTSTSNTVSEV